jgi:protein TonB
MAHPDDIGNDPPLPPGRPTYRVPIGMPIREEGRRASMLVSIAVHAVILGLLIAPLVFSRTVIERIEQGAGGAGPAGGGGGGRRGTGGSTVETLRFVRLAPDPVPTPKTLPAVIPPVPQPKVEPPKPKPVEPPPKPVEKAPEQSAAPAPQTTVAAATPGSGGGTGNDGTAGAGPGTGGGTGSGIGTGRGSATGPGTGGGNQANYPPQPIEFFLPPLPPPSSVRGFRFIAEFDVDSTGRVLDFKFTETRDGDYNRRIASVLRSMRFKPGTRPDGSPLRMKAQVGYEF